MPRASIVHSTSFRLAAVYVLLFLIVYLGANLFAYNLIASYLYERLDSHVTERFREIESAFLARGLDGARAMIANHGPAIRGQETLYSLRDAQGTFIAGNVDVSGSARGLSTLEGSALGGPDTNYRILTEKLGPNDLLVGVSYDDTNRLRHIALVSFGLATAIVMAAGLGGGAVLAFRAQRRIATLANVMRSVGAGELGRRLPISTRMDDIDTLAAAVNVSLAQLQANVVAMKQVTTDIAHDLKTPISRLFLMLEAASEADTLETGRNLTRTAMDEVKRITSTFEALLRISQIESGARRDRFRPVDMGVIMAEVIDVYSDIAAEQGRHLVKLGDGSPDAGELLGDSELIRQLLANLVHNALRHTPRGSRVVVGCQGDSRSLTIYVVDNGPGIPPEETQKVFRRFYRLEKSRTTEGTGLGLSMVKAIADLHSADIVLRDNKPGLAVLIRFPTAGKSASGAAGDDLRAGVARVDQS